MVNTFNKKQIPLLIYLIALLDRKVFYFDLHLKVSMHFRWEATFNIWTMFRKCFGFGWGWLNFKYSHTWGQRWQPHCQGDQEFQPRECQGPRAQTGHDEQAECRCKHCHTDKWHWSWSLTCSLKLSWILRNVSWNMFFRLSVTMGIYFESSGTECYNTCGIRATSLVRVFSTNILREPSEPEVARDSVHGCSATMTLLRSKIIIHTWSLVRILNYVVFPLPTIQ